MAVDKRLKLVSGLAATGGINKTGLAKVLQSLSDQGMLTDTLTNAQSSRVYRRHVQAAIDDIPLHASTSYGPLILQRELPTTNAKNKPTDGRQQKPTDGRHQRDVLHVVSPLALMSYLCSKNKALYDLIAEVAARTNNRFRLVTYIDEINLAIH